MPEHKNITKLLTGTCKLQLDLKYMWALHLHSLLKLLICFIITDINYFHCLQIVEILKETEADTRSIFGRYGSQRMKDWQEIVYLYEKDNIYLAEASQLLMRNVAYEIPGIKKSIARCEQIQHVSYTSTTVNSLGISVAYFLT